MGIRHHLRDLELATAFANSGPGLTPRAQLVRRQESKRIKDEVTKRQKKVEKNIEKMKKKIAKAEAKKKGAEGLDIDLEQEKNGEGVD